MPRTQLAWRQVSPHIDINAMTTGNAEQTLHPANRSTYPLRFGVDQMDTSHEWCVRTQNTMDCVSVLRLQKSLAETAIVDRSLIARSHGWRVCCVRQLCRYRRGRRRCRRRTRWHGFRVSVHGRRNGSPCRHHSMGHGRELPAKQSQLQHLMVASSIGSCARLVDCRPQHQHQYGNMKRNRDTERDTAMNRIVQSQAPNLEMVAAPSQWCFSLKAMLAPDASTADANAPTTAIDILKATMVPASPELPSAQELPGGPRSPSGRARMKYSRMDASPEK